jgi:hypothetical protein
MPRIIVSAVLTLILSTSILSTSLLGQSKHLWVVRSGQAVEYDPSNFSEKRTVKLPAGASDSLSALSFNSAGQILFAAPAALPLAEGDVSADRKAWLWDGHQAITLDSGVTRSTSTAGSNLVISESAPVPFLSSDGKHLLWFSNQARRLQRDGVDLSTKNTWLSWRTDLAGANREEISSVSLLDCSCPTGGCEETCPYFQTWAPQDGVGKFFLLTQFVAGQTKPVYKATSVYEENAGKWSATPLDPPLRNILDAANPASILEAVPDTGCCGWSNESDDQTLLHLPGKTINIFDELATYKNPDYDVSFYTQTGKLSPDLNTVALTIVATAKPNTAIQLAEQGQANPEESQRIRKALADLPAVEIKAVEDFSRRIAFVPHAELIGWLNDKEILTIEEHSLVVYNVAGATRRKTSILVEDAGHAFLR